MSNPRPSVIYGGSGGTPFSDQLPDGARICEVLIRHGEYVDGIRLSWITADGTRAMAAMGSKSSSDPNRTLSIPTRRF